MTEASLPSADEVRGWVGWEIDPIDSAEVGRVQGLYVDADGGAPTWLVAKLGRFGGRMVAIPVHACAAGGGRVWAAHERAEIRNAPVVDPTRPLLREHELTICGHYGIGEKVGRAAEVVGRPEGSLTSQPAIGR